MELLPVQAVSCETVDMALQQPGTTDPGTAAFLGCKALTLTAGFSCVCVCEGGRFTVGLAPQRSDDSAGRWQVAMNT